MLRYNVGCVFHTEDVTEPFSFLDRYVQEKDEYGMSKGVVK